MPGEAPRLGKVLPLSLELLLVAAGSSLQRGCWSQSPHCSRASSGAGTGSAVGQTPEPVLDPTLPRDPAEQL